jgi:hypothetical protein
LGLGDVTPFAVRMRLVVALVIPFFIYCDCVSFALDFYSLRKLISHLYFSFLPFLLFLYSLSFYIFSFLSFFYTLLSLVPLLGFIFVYVHVYSRCFLYALVLNIKSRVNACLSSPSTDTEGGRRGREGILLLQSQKQNQTLQQYIITKKFSSHKKAQLSLKNFSFDLFARIFFFKSHISFIFIVILNRF